MNREPKTLAGDSDPLALDLEELLALTAHELHEPLRKITAFGTMLKDHAGPALDEESLDYLERIQRATDRMRSTLSRVILFARVPRGLPFVTIDLGEVVQGAIEKQREQLSTASASVEVGSLPSIDGDPFQMQQLFEQLLDNAVKFRRVDAPLVVKIDAANAGDAAAEWHEVRVSDNGEGFDDAYAERIFRPFERLHGRGKGSGSGLGLSICQKIAQRHGGQMAAHGAPGQGATISVHLPAAKARARAASGGSSSSGRGAAGS